MSISAIDPSSPTDNSPNVQLRRDEQKLVADTKAHAGQAQLAADNAAIANDRLAIAAHASTSQLVDTYL